MCLAACSGRDRPVDEDVTYFVAAARKVLQRGVRPPVSPRIDQALDEHGVRESLEGGSLAAVVAAAPYPPDCASSYELDKAWEGPFGRQPLPAIRRQPHGSFRKRRWRASWATHRWRISAAGGSTSCTAHPAARRWYSRSTALGIRGPRPSMRPATTSSRGRASLCFEHPGPSVVSMNGVVASLAVTEFMVGVTGLRRPAPHLTYRGDRAVVRASTDQPEADCYYCTQLWGSGLAKGRSRTTPSYSGTDS